VFCYIHTDLNVVMSFSRPRCIPNGGRWVRKGNCRWESISYTNQSTNNMYHQDYLATAFSVVITSVKSVVARIATLF